MRPIAVAITGGIGAGKSTALEAFGRMAPRWSRATRSSTTCSPTDDDVRDALVAKLGEAVLVDGRPDRGRIAQAVFADRERLAWLEQLLHPLVSREYLEWREQLAALDEPPRVCVTEVPLLYEVGAEERFDRVVVITAPTGLREQRRRVARDDRDARLLPDREKVRRADYHYVNTGTLEELDAWVGEVMAKLEAERQRSREAIRRRVLLSLAAVAGAAAWVVSAEPRVVPARALPASLRGDRPRARENYDLPPTLLAAVIYAESKFDPAARSASGAVGLMQLLPDTARGIATRTGGDRFVVDDLLDPELNVRYGSWYLRSLLDRYDDDAAPPSPLQRRPGQRRSLAAEGSRDPVPRDAPPT